MSLSMYHSHPILPSVYRSIPQVLVGHGGAARRARAEAARGGRDPFGPGSGAPLQGGGPVGGLDHRKTIGKPWENGGLFGFI